MKIPNIGNVKIPSFSRMGAKTKMRNILYDIFPKQGGIYFEPFVGAGGSFLMSCILLDFVDFLGSDIDPFLLAIRDVDINLIPDYVENRQEWEYYKNNRSLVSLVLEPVITFSGLGYGSMGLIGKSPRYKTSSFFYQGVKYRSRIQDAQSILKQKFVTLIQSNFLDFDYSLFTWDDFVYFDPPYLGTSLAYPQIDHNKLISILNNAEFKWCISSYPNSLYLENLNCANCYVYEKYSAITNVVKTELLITNY